MKFSIGRYGIEIIPEDKEDEAYIEDTMGLRADGDSIPLVRENAFGMSCLGVLTTHSYRHASKEKSEGDSSHETVERSDVSALAPNPFGADGGVE